MSDTHQPAASAAPFTLTLTRACAARLNLLAGHLDMADDLNGLLMMALDAYLRSTNGGHLITAKPKPAPSVAPAKGFPNGVANFEIVAVMRGYIHRPGETPANTIRVKDSDGHLWRLTAAEPAGNLFGGTSRILAKLRPDVDWHRDTGAGHMLPITCHGGVPTRLFAGPGVDEVAAEAVTAVREGV